MKKKIIPRKPLLLLTTVIILILLIGILTLLQTSKNRHQARINEMTTATPTITISPTPTPPPLENIDWDTNHWKIYTGSRVDGKNKRYSFSIKYPPNWNFILRDNTVGAYYPFGLTSEKDFFGTPRILLGTGGHGGPPSGYAPRSFQSGQAFYGWNVSTNNTVYAVASFRSNDNPYTKEYNFEIDSFPVKTTEEADTLKRIFDMMLNTFTPVNN